MKSRAYPIKRTLKIEYSYFHVISYIINKYRLYLCCLIKWLIINSNGD